MKMFGFAALVAALSFSPSITSANSFFLTGNDLWKGCKINSPEASAYILGVVDTFDVFESALTTKMFCLPANVTGTQLTDMVCKNLKESPDIRHQNAAELVSGTFFTAFPCKD